MGKLNWEDSRRGNMQTAEYRGFTIKAIHDEHPENPLENWDCNWPVIVRSPDGYGGRSSFTTYNKQGGHDLDRPLARFTNAGLIHNQLHLAKLVNSTPRDLIDCYGSSDDALAEGKVLCRDAEVLLDVLTQAFDDWSDSDKLELLEGVYDILDIPVLRTTSTGYSQGDYAYLLVVATPEAKKAFGLHGNKKIADADLMHTADLYGAWAWGNTHGYVIVSPDGEELDSCWGYYGDHDESGLEEAAMEAVDGTIRYAMKRRLAKLKELIVNRVPTLLRPALLEQAGSYA